MTARIEVGNIVRSYDFQSSRDCYVEGVVTEVNEQHGFVRFIAECDMWEGKGMVDVTGCRVGREVTAPLAPYLFGKEKGQHGVVVLRETIYA